MAEVSILIGGKAGFGIDKSGTILSFIVNSLGYNVYTYRDYPSIIRGGHTFSIIRAARERISSHRSAVDYILALNQDAVALHKDRIKESSVIIYDADNVKCDGVCPVKNAVGIFVSGILKEEAAPEIMRNTCIIGAFSGVAGIEWSIVERVLRKEISRDIEINIRVARRGYDKVKALTAIAPVNNRTLPLITGSEAMGLGFLKAGLDTYIAYPMTPASPLLHFLAAEAENFSVKVIHPESEIAVMLMALGFSYCGESVAVGTSGGGFCLMTEGLSLSGMADLPVVIVLGQRPGPSTGLPTYTSQTELNFALNAGQGEFARFVTAPTDAEDSYYWAAVSLNISKRFRIPSILLTDKTICEGLFNFDIDSIKEIRPETPPASVFPPNKGTVIKVNSYEHDEYGITTEDPAETVRMQDKRLLKMKSLAEELEKYETVKCRGKNNSDTAILCWGSNGPVCEDVASSLNLKVVSPAVLSPFPLNAFKAALKGVKNIISVENNATGQLRSLVNSYGIKVDQEILKYDGRPFSVDELEGLVKSKLSA
ncbi:MAG: 2-oxoacid:acceptor oxidoreductase family protein [Candidatus Omnitrophica bacterium]|nr:2-oxoacid:acceptor oxidoreductase family protein [Candidatus Omnitrophota bacterium]